MTKMIDTDPHEYLKYKPTPVTSNKPDHEKTKEDWKREMEEKFACFGLRFIDENTPSEMPVELRKRIARRDKWYDFTNQMKEFFEPVICTPLAILFCVLAFVARLASYISCLGLFAGGWLLYQSFCASDKFWLVWKADHFLEAIFYLVLPFAGFLLSALLSKIYDYFDLRAY